MKLYELSAEYEAVMAAIEQYAAEHEGEIPDDMDAQLDAINAEREEKLRNCGMAYKGIVAEADAIRDEERRLAARRGVLESRAERLKAYIASNIGAGEKYAFPQVTLRSARSEAVEVEDVEVLGDYYCRITRTPDKAAIKAAYKNGFAVDGARIVERWNLQIK